MMDGIQARKEWIQNETEARILERQYAAERRLAEQRQVRE